MRKPRAEAESDERTGRTFESALAGLEAIIERLEGSEVPLEEAISLVQEGDELSRFCEQQLQEAEGKILQLVERLGGVELAPVEMDTDEGDR
jgi:exodeoxyribonuclease VII small subunit